MYNMVKPCSDSGAFVAEPAVRSRLDLNSCREILLTHGYKIKFASDVILLIEDSEGSVEMGLYPSGKILFKSTEKDVVYRIFDNLKTVLGNCV